MRNVLFIQEIAAYCPYNNKRMFEQYRNHPGKLQLGENYTFRTISKKSQRMN